MGVVRNEARQHPVFTGRMSANMPETGCPACEATAKMLACARGWSLTGSGLRIVTEGVSSTSLGGY
jgi:predicted nucleic acid-binding Zn ribbon protein